MNTPDEVNNIIGKYATIPSGAEVEQWLLSMPKNNYNFPVFTPKALELRESTIAGAGNGVFAAENIKKGEIICEYDGYFKASKECDERERIYSIDAGYGLCIVGDGIGAMINDIVDFRELTELEAEGLFSGKPPVSQKHNCYFKFIGEGEFSHIYILASVDVASGSELFIPYGFRYWIQQYYDKNYIDVELFSNLREKLRKRDLEECRKKYNMFNQGGFENQ